MCMKQERKDDIFKKLNKFASGSLHIFSPRSFLIFRLIPHQNIQIHHYHEVFWPHSERQPLDILDSDRAARIRDGSQNLAVLLDIDNSGTRGTNITISVSAAEGDGAKVGKRHQRTVGLKVLNDPLGVVLAQIAVHTTIEGVGFRHAGGQVLNRRGASGQAGRINGDLDRVASADGDAAEVVCVVGVPLVPSVEGDRAALDAEVDTGLEDGGAAGVTVDTNPGGGAVLLVGRAAAWDAGGRDDERAGHGRVAIADEDGTGPVGAVLDLFALAELDDLGGAGLVGRVAGSVLAGQTTGMAGLTLLCKGGSNGSRGEQAGGEDRSELHDGDNDG